MKTAIVTGVSRGLGESLARGLLAHGFAVTGIGRASAASLDWTELSLRSMRSGGRARHRRRRLAPAFQAIADAGPEFVCLINNAAVAGPVGTIGALDGAALAASIAVNLVAPVAIANLFCRMFAGATAVRRIINVSSGAADSPLPGGGPYSIAKAGLEMLTRQLAKEHDAPTFRAITIRPGVIDTDMQTFMRYAIARHAAERRSLQGISPRAAPRRAGHGRGQDHRQARARRRRAGQDVQLPRVVTRCASPARRPGTQVVVERASFGARFPREAVDLLAIGGEIARFGCRAVAGQRHDHRVAFAEVDIERHGNARFEAKVDALARFERETFLDGRKRRELKTGNRFGRFEATGRSAPARYRGRRTPRRTSREDGCASALGPSFASSCACGRLPVLRPAAPSAHDRASVRRS